MKFWRIFCENCKGARIFQRNRLFQEINFANFRLTVANLTVQTSNLADSQEVL